MGRALRKNGGDMKTITEDTGIAGRRVLHVITALGRGGAENHLLELVRHQTAVGWCVTVAHLKSDYYWAQQMRALGVCVVDLGLTRYGQLGPILRLQRLIRNCLPEVIHAHLPPAELYTRLALLGISRRKIPLILTKHNDEPFYPGFGERFIGRWVAARATKVIAISAAVRTYMESSRLGLPSQKMVTIPYGLDPNPYVKGGKADSLTLRTEWGIPENALVLGFVGRLVPQKDVPTLIRAFSLFSRHHPESRLVIVGRGPEEASLRRRAVMCGLSDRIVWAGFREDIPKVMSSFDVFVLPSKYEGFGLVLLEAMAASKPVVASRVSAIPEIVEEGKTGILVPTGDPEGFAEAFEDMADRDLREAYGAAGFKRVLREFGLHQMCQRTAEVYPIPRVGLSGQLAVTRKRGG
jgi:glycosyltransferase involved in cell wall biosynthesis